MALSDQPTPFVLTSLMKEKCPKCRKGNIFVTKHILPLKDCQKTVDYCDVCQQKIKVEANYGQGMILFLHSLFLPLIYSGKNIFIIVF